VSQKIGDFFVRLHNLIDASHLGIDDYQRLWVAKTLVFADCQN